MSKSIKVQIRSVYGEDKVYPACPAAVTFAEIAGTKTLTTATLELVERLGYRVDIEQPTVFRHRSHQPHPNYYDPSMPLDTPSLDTSFHDNEMGV